jgi:hypothetical protein
VCPSYSYDLQGLIYMTYTKTDDDVHHSENRVMVKVQCKECGQEFRLRGSLNKGKVETGVKMCFCGNEDLKMTLAK